MLLHVYKWFESRERSSPSVDGEMEQAQLVKQAIMRLMSRQWHRDRTTSTSWVRVKDTLFIVAIYEGPRGQKKGGLNSTVTGLGRRSFKEESA